MYLEYSEIVRQCVFSFGVALSVAVFCAPAKSQDQQGAQTLPRGDFFSGFIVSCSATELTVNRKGLGKETAATRTFVIDAGTKIEGVLKSKAHVTVRFVGDENTPRAVHIIVR